MKKLTIEEKAKAYDEAINRMKYYVVDEYGCSRIKVADVFPELKKSEDEKWIPKEIAKYLKEKGGFRSCWLAWLEKQGEKSSDKIVEKARTEKQRVLLTETDGSANIDWDCRSLQDVKLLLEYGLDYIKKLEKQSEQKPADKIEPKFKVEQWIVNNVSKDVFLIKSTNSGYCTLEDIKGNIISPCLPPCENESHLWTIQDAKDGDVLACNEEILLFKSYSVQGRISLYCWYNGQTNNFHSKEVTDTLLTTRNKICPATKEQRDLLFQKMKEAGYEWDAEKKKLKKVEQSTAEDIDLPEFESYLCLMFQKFRTKGIYTNGDIIDYVKEHSQKLKDILVKSSWSEEDEKKRTLLINILEVNHPNGYFKVNPANTLNMEAMRTEELVSWLKSLKDRVLPQPKQEWSEKDKAILEKCIGAVKVSCYSYSFKSEAENWLKLLKYRYTWKPSDEQMDALEHFVRSVGESGYASPYDNNTKLLCSLLSDLKKLKG